ncbi:histidinol-phosphate transaminase [Luteimonas abyssi]|uniref:histidinol-phosphate transaminase n=1 Tax=Luteimonas abyssi TaxID=1247514 RepID=UPI000737C95E|nr:histidinol-phosphate transaminase [Luteimonas abyssi]
MSVLALLREELRDFAGYSSARGVSLQGEDWLNANEAPWPSIADGDDRNRRYPDPQPRALVTALAGLYGTAQDRVLVGRGSDEGIDLLIRAACRAGRDAVLVTPPVFGMYAVGARLQDAPLVEVPLTDTEDGFSLEADRVIEQALAERVRVVFLCPPANPTGLALPIETVDRIADALRGHALVVIDEAYAEFSGQVSALALLDRHEHLVVLRTLSKAHALAAARIGAVIGHADLIAVLRRCQAPYPIPAPCADLAGAALAPDARHRTAARVQAVRVERARMASALPALPGIRRVYPSDGNFLLVRFEDADAAFAALLAAGIVVRDQRAAPQLGDALRISIGTPEQNDRVLRTLATLGPR